MFDGEQWTSTRQLMLATPITAILALALTFAIPSESPLYTIVLGSFLIAGGLNFMCLLMFHSDAKKTAERTGKKPRAWAYILAGLLVSSYVVAPIYLAIWRNV